MNAAVQRRLVIGLITLATLNALLWSVIAAPGGGGPDEPSHMRIVRTMLATGGLAEFRGYSPGAFAGGPVRAQVAHEITPNAFAVPVAAVLGLLGSDDDAFNHHMARLFSVALYPVTLWLAFLTLRRLFADMPVAPVWGVALMATAPMFTLVHSYYTNDTPAIAASTFAVYALVRASQSDFALRTPRCSAWPWDWSACTSTRAFWYFRSRRWCWCGSSGANRRACCEPAGPYSASSPPLRRGGMSGTGCSMAIPSAWHSRKPPWTQPAGHRCHLDPAG